MSGSMENPSLLLLRNEHELIGHDILVINFERDGFIRKLRKLNPESKITAFSYNMADIDSLDKNANAEAIVDVELPKRDFDLIIYYYPKSKPEAQMMFDNIRAIASQQTRLLVVGDNKGGVKSAQKQLEDKAEVCYKLESAKHCVLFEFGGLFALDKFEINSYLKRFDVKIDELTFNVVSLPGVFNHGSLDSGTALLLNALNTDTLSGNVLDFGCGAGIISAFMALKNPSIHPTALDVSALAVYATNETFKLNNVKGTTLLSDGLNAITDTYNAVVSNPPFHTGLATDYTISERFFKGAASILAKKGQLILVANSFLKYLPILQENFKMVDIPAKNNKFTIYQCQ
ncbi:methyltransferase [Pseudoalteromonas xiamenensis]